MQEDSNAQDDDPKHKKMRQTVLMLNLAVAQISFSMRQGDESVDTLAKAFSGMIDTIKSVEEHARNLSESEGNKQVILDRCANIESTMHEIIMAFQFYDKLSQRLDHVGSSLESLSDIIGDEEKLNLPESWVQLQSYIRSKYSMKEELDMFDAIISGLSVEDALRQVTQSPAAANDDVELF